MPEIHKRIPLGELLREQVQTVQGLLHGFQKEAEKTLKDLAERGKNSRKELDRLVARLEKSGWSERSTELARDLGSELVGHLDELQGKVIKFAGVATADQVELLSREIRRLASKVDGLAKGGKKRSKPAQS